MAVPVRTLPVLGPDWGVEGVPQSGPRTGRVLTGTGKPGKISPSQGKVREFEKMSKSQGILNESGKSQGKL